MSALVSSGGSPWLPANSLCARRGRFSTSERISTTHFCCDNDVQPERTSAPVLAAAALRKLRRVSVMAVALDRVAPGDHGADVVPGARQHDHDDVDDEEGEERERAEEKGYGGGCGCG